MSSEKKTKKRTWGGDKSMETGNVIKIERMDLEKPDPVKLSHKDVAETSKSNLQHPEMLSTQQLMDILTSYRVPVEGHSRELLVHLFHKHVTPRPQRVIKKRQSREAEKEEEDTEMEWSESEFKIAEDWDNVTIQRKRKLDEIESLPVAKKHVPLSLNKPPVSLGTGSSCSNDTGSHGDVGTGSHDNGTSSSGLFNAGSHGNISSSNSSNIVRTRKLKRPCGSVNAQEKVPKKKCL